MNDPTGRPEVIRSADLADLLALMAPLGGRPGANALLRLCLHLLLTGGRATLSFGDLTNLLGCNRASVAEARRLGERLAVIRCSQGESVAGRPGPAPFTWTLALPGTGTGSEPATGTTSEPAAATAGGQREPVRPDPDQTRCSGESDGPDPDALAPLIADAARRLGEPWPAKMDERLRPLLVPLLTDGWTPDEIGTLLDGCIAACLASARRQGQPPRHRASYLRAVVMQRLGRVSSCPAPAEPPPPTSRPTLPAPPLVIEPAQERPPMGVLASPASSSAPTPCGPPMTAPSGLPPAQVAAALREDLVRAAPQLADVLRYGSFTLDLRTDGVILLVGTEHLRRQLTIASAFRLVERAVARLLGGATPVAIRVMAHADDSPRALVGSHCPDRLAG